MWGKCPVSFFSFGYLVVSILFDEKTVLSPLNGIASLSKIKHKHMCFFLESHFYFIDLYVYLYACTILSWLLFLISKFYKSNVSPPTGSSFSRLFWLFWVPCNYKLILELVCQFLQKVSWNSNRECTGSVDKFGEYYHLNNTKCFNLWTWNVFSFI